MNKSIVHRAAWAALLLTLAIITIVLVRNEPPPSADSRIRRLSQEIRCPQCSAETVADSQAATARAARTEIEAQVAAGKSDTEIRQFFVDRYGQDIILRPPASGSGALLWLAPIAVLATGAVLIAARVRKKTRTVSASSPRRAAPVAYVVGMTLTLIALGVAAYVAASDRKPGESATGGVVLSRSDQVDQAIANSTNDPIESLRQLDSVIAADPNNVEAHTYRGWILVQAGLGGEAPDVLASGMADLDLAVKLAPETPDAYVFRGIARLRGLDDPLGAATDLRTFLALVPPDSQTVPIEMVEATLQEALDLAASRGLSVPAVATLPK